MKFRSIEFALPPPPPPPPSKKNLCLFRKIWLFLHLFIRACPLINNMNQHECQGGGAFSQNIAKRSAPLALHLRSHGTINIRHKNLDDFRLVLTGLNLQSSFSVILIAIMRPILYDVVQLTFETLRSLRRKVFQRT